MTRTRLAHRLARWHRRRQLRTAHYQAAIEAGANLRRTRGSAIRRAERVALAAFLCATVVSLIVIAACAAVVGRMAGWW